MLKIVPKKEKRAGPSDRELQKNKMNYEIVKYRPEFKEQIIELQTHLWSPDVSVNSAYLKWKYERNPYMDTPLIYVALCKGKVVGMRGMYGSKWEIGHPSQTLSVACAGDSVTAPEHRKCGVYKRITRVALKDLSNTGHSYVFSLSTGPITLPSSMSMGWRAVGSLHTRIRSSKQKKNKKVPECNPFNKLDKNMEEKVVGINRRLSIERAPRPDQMAKLVKTIGHDGRIRHVRDQEFFEWRFGNPLSEYRFLFWGDSSLQGYLVLRAPIHKHKTKVSIVDWEASDFQIKSHLLHEAISLGDFESLSIWSASLSEQEVSLLDFESFKHSEHKAGIAHYQLMVLIRSVRNGILGDDWAVANKALLDINNWDLRLIYSDAY